MAVAGVEQAADRAVQFAGGVGDDGRGGGAGECVEVGQFGNGVLSYSLMTLCKAALSP